MKTKEVGTAGNTKRITDCPKIYRKSVLQLLKYTANLYRFAVNFETLSILIQR